METVLTTTLSAPTEIQTEAFAPERFDEIVRLHQKRVYRVVYLLVRDHDVAGTLTQECFLRAYQKRASFRGECRLDTWLLRIAVNLARDHGKNRRASFWRKLIGLEESGEAAANAASAWPSPERVLLGREELKQVWNATAGLSPQQREIFLLRYAEEMSIPEVAALLDLKEGTVKAQLFRATGKIREILRVTP
ncbi:MAG: sigma-70 family RNA polymerase sigma factor [Acidobacteria bacterium]|nr:sigma-70 family RNA polymerase sigma factor [Acidobacteriota bacterium]